MTKNIIWIDQKPLIQKAIEDLEAWHEKIESLEIEIQRFQDKDLKLYNEWYTLTSQIYQKEIDQIFEVYRKLAEFHNWIIYTAEDQNITLPEAYYLMAQEEEKFSNGTEREREQIQKIRDGRQRAIDGNLDDDEPFAEDELSEEEQRQHAEEKISDARAYHERELDIYEAMSEKEIRKIMKDPSDGLMLLIQCVTICLETYRFDLILKIWNATPPKIKKTFNKGFQKEFGMSLDDLLNRATDKAREDAGVEDDEDFDFARHFEDPFMRSKPKTKPKQTEDSELAKIFYRRLMLKIHPDKLSKEFMVVKKPWLDRLWKKIQLAYNDVNVSSLQNLYLQVLISLKQYDEVTYSELKHGSELLKKEFSRIRDSQAGNLSHPAWGFSALKSYKKLERQISEPYMESKKRLLHDKARLEDLHASLKLSAESALRNGGFQPIRRRKRRARRRRW
ncbi:MAG: hypothetical protein JNM24_12175 [Bdellovibrionaceae bacterium]|nr:hypothetical protein [Pseudobdellovibrionaceae bacterium]